MDRLQLATGLAFTMEKVDTVTPVYVSVSFSDMPAWDFMRRLAESPNVQGTWEKTAEGYHLLGKNIPADAAPAPGQPGQIGWVFVGGLLGILLCLGLALLMWRRRKAAESGA